MGVCDTLEDASLGMPSTGGPETEFWVKLLSDKEWRNVLPHVVMMQCIARGFIVRKRNAREFQNALNSFTIDYSATYIQAIVRGRQCRQLFCARDARAVPRAS